MPRISVIALQGVIDYVSKKLRGGSLLPDRTRGAPLLKAMQHVDLLRRIQISEYLAVKNAAALVHTREPVTVKRLQMFKRPAKLAIDVIDDAGPRSSRILVGRNDLIAHRGESPGFVETKKSPRSSIPAAGHTCATRGGCCKSRLQESSAIQFDGRFHRGTLACTLKSGSERICDEHHEQA